ncbi:serpin family protein [uncultured Methylovirgula sp.]|uniref:serpin family protein n=1 Tax=uncultured Methylovirgula sp. TaxID=1285960 RepID=UPI0026083CD2|nr:serpin family protein [uncultured Methylovirgula sp.]
MNFFRVIAPMLCLAAALLCGATASATAPTAPEQTLVSGYNSTGQRLFQDLAKAPDNIVLSPYSVGSALSMVLAGARGDTAKAIGDALQLNLSPADLADANAALIADLKSANDKNSAVLNSANALAEVKPDVVDADFRSLLQKHYAAEIFPGDLNAINRWIAQKTSGKISHLLDSLPDGTGFVLANAAYFKAFWQYPFDKAETENGTFHLTAVRDVEVPMMHDEDHFALVKGKDFKAIRLPYRSADERLGMIVVLPDAIDGLAAVIAELGPKQLADLFADFGSADFADVQLQLPRFHTGYRASLAAPLEKVGMGPAFNLQKADFSGMTGRPPAELQVAIADVIHNAVIDVNEESSEAAAATAVPMAATAMAPVNQPPPEPFIVDRPFLFFIVDQKTGAVLFQGRIVDPRH